ncbi:MAG: DUF4783 domain-containing protein [Flavobacteriales bacterium]|nr:DUF4783 domain-containing protein [Flavobacteriales bacterium]MDW8410598.1 DUF4783 domain-containing protein [Flavobacteriales bacterium]
MVRIRPKIWVLFLLPCVVHGQILEMTTALRQGNAAALAQYFSPTVELTTPHFSGSCGERQAREILSGFFMEQKPVYLVQKSFSESGPHRHYIGTLRTQSGQSFRVVIHTFRDMDRQRDLVRTLRFESER